MTGKAAFLVFLAAFSATSQAATSDPYLLEDVIAGKLAPVSEQQMLDSLASGKVISIGESHEVGLERDDIGQVYEGLASRLTEKPRACLVESYPVLVDGRPADDPMKASFFSVCAAGTSINNDGVYYQDLFARNLDLKSKTPIVTHTGFRHILPWGLLYPRDYPTHPLDREAQGTLTLQLPKKFAKSGLTMRSHATIAVDDLLVQMIRSELAAGTSPRAIAEKLGTVMSALGIGKAQRKYLEVTRVEQKFPYHRAYITLIDHGILKTEQIQALLFSPELKSFLDGVEPGHVQVGYWRGDRGGQFEVGSKSIDRGGYLYLTGPKKNANGISLLVGIFPEDGKAELSELKEPSSTPVP